LPGTLVLYYGDELGMTDVDVPLELQVDAMSLARPGQPTRDRCRTPMPWSAAKNGGFTDDDVRPWLPLGEHSSANVQTEEADPGSVLNFWRRLSHLRRDGSIGGLAGLERVALDEQVWAYRLGEATTVANLSSRPAVARMPGAAEPRTLISTHHESDVALAPGVLALQPWEAVVLVL